MPINRFMSSLDSAKTAHFNPNTNAKDNWWIPDTKEVWQHHIDTGIASCFKQILWGETIVLPRNVYMDSPGWFELAPFFLQSERPIFKIALFGKEIPLTPEQYVIDIATTFGKAGGGNLFSLSAWPGLSDRQRKSITDQIKSNLEDHRNNESKKIFAGMTKNIGLDDTYEDKFEQQEQVLDDTFHYLEKNPGIITRAEPSSLCMWEYIQRRVDSMKLYLATRPELGSIFLNEISKVISEIGQGHNYDLGWLSIRTNLYEEIYHITDPIMKEYLRILIDECYDLTLSNSLKCQSSSIDRSDTNLNVDDRLRFNDLMPNEFNNGESVDQIINVSIENLVPRFISKPGVKGKALNDIVDALNDGEILQLMDKRSEFLKKPNLSATELGNYENIYRGELAKILKDNVRTTRLTGKPFILINGVLMFSKTLSNLHIQEFLPENWLALRNVMDLLADGQLEPSVATLMVDNLISNDRIWQISEFENWLIQNPARI